jgi:hypothetical protein
MNLLKILFISLWALLAVTSFAMANDFGWTEDLNIQAQADPSGFRARLATRFNLGDVEVRAVLGNIGNPADAYIILRLGEMSGRPTSYVVDRYRQDKGKGWGALAKSLGIKPGSEEFHALKSGQDLYPNNKSGQVFDSANDHGKSAGKGKSKK